MKNLYFENISIKFQGGNRYGLIGANGCGKSTFMKILTGELAPTHGTVSVSEGERLGVLRQDQFAYEDYRVVDTVIMGHEKLWEVKKERDRIYALPEMSEEDGNKVAELEMEFAEMDGYMAESSASELLLGLDIPGRPTLWSYERDSSGLEVTCAISSGVILRSGNIAT